jgi:hypothetical protein
MMVSLLNNFSSSSALMILTCNTKRQVRKCGNKQAGVKRPRYLSELVKSLNVMPVLPCVSQRVQPH